MVDGVELMGKGVDILRIGGAGTNLNAYKSHVEEQTGDVDAFVTNTDKSNAAVATLQGQSAARICIPRHQNPMKLPSKVNHVTDRISFHPSGEADKAESTVKVQTMSALVTQRASSMGITAAAILPKGLVGSVGYASQEVKKTRSDFTGDTTVYYTHASIPFYKLILEEREHTQAFAAEVASLPTTCAAPGDVIKYDAFVSQFGTHHITGLVMGGSFTIISTHSYETCSTYSNTEALECVEAGLATVIGEMMGGGMKGAAASSCPTKVNASTCCPPVLRSCATLF